jgi:HEAT repeat protein
MPEPGAVDARFEDGLVDLRANGAPRSEILQTVARIAGFELDVADSGVEDRALTARIEAPLFDVLALLLRGVDYELEVRFDARSQSHRIARLHISRQDESRQAEGDGGLLAAPLPEPLAALLESEDSGVVVAVVEALRRAGDPRAIPELAPLLDDDDPAVREAAIAAIDALEELGFETNE